MEWYNAEGRLVEDDGSLPQLEAVNVQDFDGKNFDRAWVPETAFDDPSMPTRPEWPPGTKRVLSLAEYIKLRERQTGWRLFDLKPQGAFMGMYLLAILSWDVRTKRERGER